MTGPEQGENFETYPYADPDSPEPDAVPPVREYPVTPSPLVQPIATGPASASRRSLLIGALSVGFAGLVGVAVFNANSAPQPDAEPSLAYPEGEMPEEPVEEPGYATLSTTYGDIGTDVPLGWAVESEGTFLAATHPHGRLAARAPERRITTADDLAREADYLREGFEPGGTASVADESDTRFTVLIQTVAGEFQGEPATEHVTLVVNGDNDQALVVYWVVADGQVGTTAEARSMERQLRRGFEDF